MSQKAKWRELRGLAELLAFVSKRKVAQIDEHSYDSPISNVEGHAASATFDDGAMLLVVTDYDAGYSEMTPGNGATVSYWVTP